MPRVLPIDAERPDPAVIAEAAAVLRSGGLVAFPTETVYGLGARGLHGDEVAKIFAAKGRPPNHPLILHVPDELSASAIASVWSETASRLAGAFWPGPMTLVVPRRASVPDLVSAGLPTVGIRVPAHPVAHELVRAAGEPIAAPSANAHMHVSPTTAEHVVRSLGDAVDLVLDAGPCEHGIESTVVDASVDPPRVLRPGALGLDALRSVVPAIAYRAETALPEAARASPGLASRHYAPRGVVVEARGPEGIAAAVTGAVGSGARVGALTWSPEARESASVSGAHAVRALPPDAVGFARDLFGALYALEADRCDVIVVEAVPDAPAWWAVADRLRRARAG
ncbi:MAG TPA: L-threonylcarbamoyladenylate synthase [Labilithrix sp.]